MTIYIKSTIFGGWFAVHEVAEGRDDVIAMFAAEADADAFIAMKTVGKC